MSEDKVKMAVEYAVNQLNRANNGKYFKNQISLENITEPLTDKEAEAYLLHLRNK